MKWASDPGEHDYAAARDFLELVATPGTAARIVRQLQAAPTVTRWKAKDVLRCVGTDGNPLSALLPAHNRGVHKQLQNIDRGRELSPVLLVRDLARRTLVIADGDHRVSAVYLSDENALVPCRIADWD